MKKEEITKKLDYGVSPRKMKEVYDTLSNEGKRKFRDAIKEFRNGLFIRIQKYKKQPQIRRTIDEKFRYLNELEGVLKGKPSEAEVKAVTAKVRGIAKKLKIPFSRESTTSVRGFHTYTTGIKISSEPYFHPYEYTQVEYIYGGHGSLSKEAEERKDKILSLIISKVRKLGHKVTKHNDFLKIET